MHQEAMLNKFAKASLGYSLLSMNNCSPPNGYQHDNHWEEELDVPANQLFTPKHLRGKTSSSLPYQPSDIG